MPQGKNCPNCGAPYDPALNKCPYCGTIYFDMSCINFADGEPIYMKIKTEWRGKPVTMTQLVRPRLHDIHVRRDRVETTRLGLPVVRVNLMPTVTIDVEFEAIANDNNELIIVEEE